MKKQAYTLIEIMIIVIGIGVLTAISLVSYENVIESARYERARVSHGDLNAVVGPKIAADEDAVSLRYDFDEGSGIVTNSEGTFDYILASSYAGADITWYTDTSDDSPFAFQSDNADVAATSSNGTLLGVDLGAGGQKSLNNEISIGTWINVRSATTPGEISLIYDVHGDWGLVLDSTTGDLSFNLEGFDGTSNGDSLVASGAVVAGGDSWHYIIATYNGDRMSIYVDGEKVAERIDAAAFPIANRILRQVRIGEDTTVTEFVMDAVRVFSYSYP